MFPFVLAVAASPIDAARDLAVVVVLVVAGVVLWTLRTTHVARGDHHRAAAAAATEAMLFVSVVARVLDDLGPLSLVGYGVGVALGTYAGSWLGSHARGEGAVEIRAVLDDGGDEVAAGLMGRGWPVTAIPVSGVVGDATVLFTVVDRSHQDALTAELSQLAPEAFWTVEELRGVRPSILPTGLRQVGSRDRHTGVRTRRTSAPSESRACAAADSGHGQVRDGGSA